MRTTLVIFLFFCLGQGLHAQSFPRDTSYTITKAWLKIKKNYPYVRPVRSQSLTGVLESRDVVYVRRNRDLHLDIFHPPFNERSIPSPAVLMVHGGGWSSGSKENLTPMARQLAAQGFVTVALEYRLSPEAKYPAAVYDIKSALCWVKANASDYNIDTGKIAVLGCSAGGQLATLAGTTLGKNVYNAKNSCPGNSIDVHAIINIDGIVSFIHPESEEGKSATKWLNGSMEEAYTTWKEASPLEYADATTPPILFINSGFARFHAGRDDMIAILNQHNIYSEVHHFSDAPHSFWLVHPWFEPTMDRISGFLDFIWQK